MRRHLQNRFATRTKYIKKSIFFLVFRICANVLCANRKRNEFYSTRGFSFFCFSLFFSCVFLSKSFRSRCDVRRTCFSRLDLRSIRPKLAVACCQVRSYIIPSLSLSSSSSPADHTNMEMRQCGGLISSHDAAPQLWHATSAHCT